MEGISDIRIVSIDEKRPPRIGKEPYIDLYFRLTHKAPADWCQDFTDLQSKATYPSKINIDECLYIETWVRRPEEIIGHVQSLKEAVAQCNARYIERIEARQRDRDNSNDKLTTEEGPQGQLNRIIAGLDFSE
ncbi:MAG: hypothetical protein JSW09_09930 [Pseudomonadota bacterium]|nr:MAG: hypothetical protein JSW09_09930 [Pseudomonadota bacterium]